MPKPTTPRQILTPPPRPSRPTTNILGARPRLSSPTPRAAARAAPPPRPPSSSANTRTPSNHTHPSRPPAGETHGDDDLHLVERERHAETAPHAAAEREEGVGARPLADEAVGIEPLRVGPGVRSPVRQVDARRDDGSGGEIAAADPHRAPESPPDD